MKCLCTVGFVNKITERVNVVENFHEIDPEVTVNNKEDSERQSRTRTVSK